MLNFTDLTLRRGQSILFDKANARISTGDKVGLVGKNGCGKSSLLALLKQELIGEMGEICIPKDWRIAWVNQETPALDTCALDYTIQGDRYYCQLQAKLKQANANNDGHQIAEIHAQLEQIDGWSIQARASRLLQGLGFHSEQLHKPIKSFSGGWRMRLNLAQALLCPSDLLLLDEPTNHLDLDAVIWLERWLKQYAGTLILISHDRDFLDPIVNKILHIEQQKILSYTGNYSSFERQRATKLAQQNALHHHQQQKIAHLQRYIDRFKAKATKAKQAQSRMKALEKMTLIAPAYADNPFTFTFFEPLALPNPLVRMENVSAGYQEKEKNITVLQNIKLNLVPNSRLGLLGKNGAGKSTLIKLLAQENPPQTGDIQLAKGVKVGYFAQHQLDTLRADESPLWHLQKLAPEQTEQQLRDYLASFAFQGDKVHQAVAHFSGGEKARLVLALIVWQRPNLLLLDEPTNHLDLDMRQALTEALVNYQGAMVVVSHDRHLLRNTVDEFYLVDNQSVAPFQGDLADYQKWLNEENEIPSTTPNNETPRTGELRKAQKRQQAELRQKLAPLQKQLTHLEKEQEKIQAQLEEIDSRLTDSTLYQSENKACLLEILNTQTQLKHTLTTVEEAWFSLEEEIDSLKKG